MIELFTSFCVFFVTVLILKKIYELLNNYVLGPTLFGSIDFKKKGQWAGKSYVLIIEMNNTSRFILLNGIR